jgi:histidine decarboxylase
MKDPFLIESTLGNFKEQFDQRVPRVLGYPCNQDFQYPEIIDFLKYHINNVGSTFDSQIPYPLNTHSLEAEVIEYLLELYGSTGLDAHRGYITTGGTEGNFYGMYLGREHFSKNCLFVFSKSVHYSIYKAANILDVEYRLADIDIFGEIDYNDFDNIVRNTNKNIVVVANVGSTMTGAMDHVDKLIKILDKHGKNYYIHCDAALSGMMIPFLEKTIAPALPCFKKNVYSIAISGHKFLGSPIPCGVVLADRECMDKVTSNIDYIHSNDYTITGSRSGLSPLILWLALKKKDWNEQAKDVHHCIDLARYMQAELNLIIDGRRAFIANEYSNTVVFPKPSKDLIDKWFLATQDEWAHCVIMPSVSKDIIDCFLDDIRAEQMRDEK